MLKEPVSYPIAETDVVRLIQVTDPHLFADPEAQLLGVNTAASFQAVLDTFLASDQQADIMLASGDISQDYSPQSYQHFSNAVTKLDMPCHYLPGNHDDPRLMSLHMQGKQLFGQQRIIIGNWQILMLDSTVRGKPGGFMAEDQFKLIDAAIKADPEKHVLLVMHHNPILVQCSWLDQHCMINGDNFLQRMGEYPQVKAALWGHVHQAIDSEHQGANGAIHLMATPSTCIQFKPKSSYFALDGLQPGYRLLELASNGSIHTNVYRVPGENFSPDNDASGY
ncbi:phosphodiesterase [Shewanella sp. 10N.286.52.C2]|uniref:3',5'-cyclic-AMP phosphodiesterase n=1 Tax=unclassified Shewanella TaxID=196818 RepID=UPI000C827826|nr:MULTISPECIES: 3',5'-cyclic-AMP phosphodiesterase [unclassified Shewanella]PMG30670.1 phosphodiesterase [Shewanella sp. 10N.286.52.C2]PMH98048.1 phosphodiesterase [Shewanella sp. 10N.286.48.A6]